MEIILTVLITLGVVALAFAVRGVARLSRRVDDLELVRMEIVDIESKIERHQDHHESSIDRRFDNIWTVVHTIDKVVNPNKGKIIK